MVETIEALVDAGSASAGPPLGPALGPMGINIKEVMQTQKAAELTTEESKKALAVLSEMLKENIFPLEKFEKIRKYAEECKDERVKDMVRIVQKHFHKTQEENSEVVIRIVE